MPKCAKPLPSLRLQAFLAIRHAACDKVPRRAAKPLPHKEMNVNVKIEGMMANGVEAEGLTEVTTVIAACNNAKGIMVSKRTAGSVGNDRAGEDLVAILDGIAKHHPTIMNEWVSKYQSHSALDDIERILRGRS
jgi:hypothetical protein